ncbi:MAG: DUF479 domain-containing protein [Flavobacteriales bacterium]|nr:DUF479 domain-containing protein [Flavobacteriales bacterium]
MNFLGHLYVSGPEPLVIVGNFMGDEVKGRDLSHLHPSIQKGVRLHRAIDSFTDRHPLQRLGRSRVRPHAGRYAGVVMDMFYDHLLASDPHWWAETPLKEFAPRMYTLLTAHEAFMPEATRRMLRYMATHDWLTSYGTIEGIGGAIAGLARRVPQGAPMIGSEEVLQQHFSTYRAEFREFLPALQAHVAHLV